jgi:hypothetical protein
LSAIEFCLPVSAFHSPTATIHDDDREPDAKADLLRAFRQRPAAHGLDRIEQKVAAIQ